MTAKQTDRLHRTWRHGRSDGRAAGRARAITLRSTTPTQDRTARIAGAISAHDAATTPAELAPGCDIIVTMLPSSAIVAAVLEGAAGALAACRGALIDRHVERRAGRDARAGDKGRRGAAVAMIDAPVSGGVSRARTGELAIMAGGGDAEFDRAEPVLAAMGKSLIRTGGVGAAPTR